MSKKITTWTVENPLKAVIRLSQFVCVYHMNRCKLSTFSRGLLGNMAVSGQRRRCNVPVKTYLLYFITIYIYIHLVLPLGAYKTQLGGRILYRWWLILSLSPVILILIVLYVYICVYIYILCVCRRHRIFVGLFCTFDAFQLHNSKKRSKQVCYSCWIRPDGMIPSGNAFPGSKQDPWIETWSEDMVNRLSKVKLLAFFEILFTHCLSLTVLLMLTSTVDTVEQWWNLPFPALAERLSAECHAYTWGFQDMLSGCGYFLFGWSGEVQLWTNSWGWLLKPSIGLNRPLRAFEPDQEFCIGSWMFHSLTSPPLVPVFHVCSPVCRFRLSRLVGCVRCFCPPPSGLAVVRSPFLPFAFSGFACSGLGVLMLVFALFSPLFRSPSCPG